MVTRPPRYKTPQPIASSYWQLQLDSNLSKKSLDTSLQRDDQSNNQLLQINMLKDSFPELKQGSRIINFKHNGNSKGRLYGIKAGLQPFDSSQAKKFFFGLTLKKQHASSQPYKPVANKTTNYIEGVNYERANRIDTSHSKRRGEMSLGDALNQRYQEGVRSNSREGSKEEKKRLQPLEHSVLVRDGENFSKKSLEGYERTPSTTGDYTSNRRGRSSDVGSCENLSSKSREHLHSKDRLKRIIANRSQLHAKVIQPTLELYASNKTETMSRDSDIRLSQHETLPNISSLLRSSVLEDNNENKEARKAKLKKLQSEAEFHRELFMRTVYKGIKKHIGKSDKDAAFEQGCEMNRLSFKSRLQSLKKMKKQ